MESFKSYLLTMVVTALLCALVTALIPDSSPGKRAISRISGLLLLLAICKPLGTMEAPVWSDPLGAYHQEAQDIEEQTLAQQDQQLRAVICGQLETYIEEEGNTLGAQIQASVTLDQEMSPDQVELSGEVSPYVKARLTRSISDNLGIPKERQVWNP